MINRFDLEQDIMKAWNIVDDIKLLNEMIMDGAVPLTEDQICNILIGMEHIYELRFNKLFSTFEKCIKSGDV
jgi:hypothetical protein